MSTNDEPRPGDDTNQDDEVNDPLTQSEEDAPREDFAEGRPE